MNSLSTIPRFRKTNVVMLEGVMMIVMAVLQADAENPITYSVCNAHDLKGSQHGISLADAELVRVETLTAEIRQRAGYFA